MCESDWVTSKFSHIPDGLPPVVSCADARAAGLSPRALRHERFAAPHHGVRVLEQHSAGELFPEELMVRRAAEYAPLLRTERGEAFSHTTALLLLDAPIHTAAHTHVTIPTPHGPARGRNVRGHSSRVGSKIYRIKKGSSILPVVAPAIALLKSVELLSFRELVVGVDAMLRTSHRRAPFATPEDLSGFAKNNSEHGIERLRAALCVARVGADSRMESLMHFEMARLGIDTLELQANLENASGRWIGRFDALDRSKRRILEYDGDQHRTDRRQYLRDIERLERARSAGYEVLRLQREDFFLSRLHETRRRICEHLECEPNPIPRALIRYFAEPY